MITKNKTHGRFWSLLKETPGYDARYKEEMKSGLVEHYSNGKTASLSDLYERFPESYERMIYEMKLDRFQSPQAKRMYDPEADSWRKRVLAAICSWLSNQSVVFEDSHARISYAQSVACRAANCRSFNKISVTRLAELYNAFLKRKAVIDNVTAVEQSVLMLSLDQLIDQIKKEHNLN
jgi:hypothetical protein